jgi:hypothetical protein
METLIVEGKLLDAVVPTGEPNFEFKVACRWALTGNAGVS